MPSTPTNPLDRPSNRPARRRDGVEMCKDITLGQRLRQFERPGISISEVEYSPGARMAPHAHEHSNISLVIRGSFEESSGGDRRQLGPGSLVFKPGGTVHSNHYGPRGARAMIIEFRPGTVSGDWFDAGAPPGCRWFVSGPCVTSAIRAYSNTFLQPQSSGLSEAALSDIIDILATSQTDPAVSSGRPLHPCVRDARDLLHERFALPIGTQQVAAIVGVHPVYLARIFRKQLHCSVITYRQRLQVAEAARQVAQSVRPLAAIADACGFADQSHMTRAFRAAVGLTPGRYRRVSS